MIMNKKGVSDTDVLDAIKIIALIVLGYIIIKSISSFI